MTIYNLVAFPCDSAYIHNAFLHKGLRMTLRPLQLLAVLTCLTYIPSHAVAAGAGPAPGVTPWSLFAGYGVTHPGFGGTKVYVETADLVLHYEKPLTAISGASWYRGYHSLFVELPVALVVEPDVAPMVGVNFLAAWTFTEAETVTPYLFIGGGPVYTEADIPGLGAHLNGNYQIGIGVRMGRNSPYRVEYRHHHISNGSTETPNDPLNSGKLLFGMSF